MGIFSEWKKLTFLRLGDEVWTPVYTPKGIGMTDVVYLNGQFYAFTYHGKLVLVDISSSDPKTIDIAEPPEGFDSSFSQSYLVESVGELFLVASFDDNKWTQVKSLDNRALFVGSNASFAILPSNHSECESNCIFYTDDGLYSLMIGVASDMGMFDVETEDFILFMRGQTS
ncbi:putative F-box protein At5g60060 [Macadamia integrifolia]|uniref:putative F-box protein At5g60060 n=1 Tax=Macadamia integrifolia TaxID=60698 RepID=UPI001C4E4617|nr:putative F-box protein At5g60060 [Macadamia integrifolia]